MITLQFKVERLEQHPSGTNDLQLTHTTYPDCKFTTFVGSMKIEGPSPPKQCFVNDTQQQQEEQTDQLPEDYVEEDLEPAEDSATERSAN